MMESQNRRATRRHRRRSRKSAVVSATVALCCLVLPANAQGLPFYWYFDSQADFTLPSCNVISIGFSLNSNSTVQAVPPYYLIAYPVGQIPQIFPVTATAAADRYSWRVGYSAGSQLLLSFVDSAGNTGGVGPLYTVVAGTVNCDLYVPGSSPISFTTNPSSQPSTCQSVELDVQGGIAPYTLSVVVSADTPRNMTFPNSTISFKNALTGGSAFVAALSDSTGTYAPSSSLIYSGGGSDTSCFSGINKPAASSGPTSGGRNGTSIGEEDGKGSGLGKAEMVGVAVAIVAAIAAAAFLLYRRRKKRQTEAMLNSRANVLDGNGQNGWGSNGSSPGNGREKKAGLAGGMWRPESPTEFPGMAPIPVRFRVTNPDDDARSEYSMRTGQASRGGLVGNDSRLSIDTVRTGSDTPDGSYNRRGQRQSLIDGDALYPPSPNYATLPSSARSKSASPSTPNSLRPLRGPPSMDDSHEAWPTYSSAASTSTEDHYMDHPASSAGALGGKRGQPTGELDLEEMLHDDESYAPSTLAGSEFDRNSVMTRTMSTGSNAYGSPFADSQRIRQ